MNGHQLTNYTLDTQWLFGGGHKFKNVGMMPNSWTDWEQIWHTYAYSSGNGHELTINPLIPEGLGVYTFKHVGRWQTAAPIWNKFGTRMHIHLGMDMSETLTTRYTRGMRVRGSSIQNLGNFPNRSGPNLTHVWRFIWEWTSAKKLTLRASREIWRGIVGVTQSKNVGKMPNSLTDRDEIWHKYAY